MAAPYIIIQGVKRDAGLSPHLRNNIFKDYYCEAMSFINHL